MLLEHVREEELKGFCAEMIELGYKKRSVCYSTPDF